LSQNIRGSGSKSYQGCLTEVNQNHQFCNHDTLVWCC